MAPDSRTGDLHSSFLCNTLGYSAAQTKVAPFPKWYYLEVKKFVFLPLQLNPQMLMMGAYFKRETLATYLSICLHLLLIFISSCFGQVLKYSKALIWQNPCEYASLGIMIPSLQGHRKC